jgi:hypothetical protein
MQRPDVKNSSNKGIAKKEMVEDEKAVKKCIYMEAGKFDVLRAARTPPGPVVTLALQKTLWRVKLLTFTGLSTNGSGSEVFTGMPMQTNTRITTKYNNPWIW